MNKNLCNNQLHQSLGRILLREKKNKNTAFNDNGIRLELCQFLGY